jgi:hypothetical protein
MVLRTDALCNTAYRLLGGIFSLVAMMFYSNRIWRVSLRRYSGPVEADLLSFLGGDGSSSLLWPYSSSPPLP